ncbi:hypothetical protein [Halobacterium sp. KA-6]|uniref:hypothetical protein n=1 Tax=Halobacterium sp. KA-6 TaxID=2896368 RepID=UPI001E5F6377|nr:hypothetical protein [Halobacterium sp. KA-6]MCD2204422.1 hypothetical protein [Halobacterium sp. KA-6]
MTLTETASELVANNLQIAAPLVALAASWVLYGVLGKRMLGADDDYWPQLRNRLLPILHRLGATSGLYAQGKVLEDEFVGTVQMPEDEFERELEAAGFYRNPLSAVKRSPNGWESDGSWARRYGKVRWLADALRSLQIPVAGPPGRMLGRFLAAAGDIMARRQTDVTIFTQTQAGATTIWVFAHDEPNSLNPLTAWRHYVAKSWNAQRGVKEVRGVLEDRNINYQTDVS